MSRRWMLALLLAAFSAVGLAQPIAASAAAGRVGGANSIRHVFVIVLENQSASTTFGSGSPAPYLSGTLRAQGAYVPNYYGIGHESNDNYIAMISGQAPNVQTQADCQVFDAFVPGTTGAYGQAQGSGCVYPSALQTVGSQLTAAGFSWRDYNEQMGATPAREAGVCGHPAVNSSDNTQTATAADQYATRHDPFVYFHSIIDDTTLCDTHVLNLDQLPQDLASEPATPNYVFITPDLCNDGHDSPCKNGDPGGLPQADKFLQQWVPRITGSPAFRHNGLLIITFDEAATSDTSSCCGAIPGPGSPKPGINGPGGGRVGAVLLSPCIAPGTISGVAYNHYSMLRSVEDSFGLSHLGYAALPGETSFGTDLFNRPCGLSPPPPPGPPATAVCSRLSGRLVGRALTPVMLGMTRARARRLFARRATRGRRYMDFFCPTHYGIRTGYPSPALLRTLSRAERERVQGRVVLALTANSHYMLRGVRPGVRLGPVARRLGVGRGYRIGLNTWYLAPNGASRGVLKVRRGVVEEIGVANRELTANRRAARRFLSSFGG